MPCNWNIILIFMNVGSWSESDLTLSKWFWSFFRTSWAMCDVFLVISQNVRFELDQPRKAATPHPIIGQHKNVFLHLFNKLCPRRWIFLFFKKIYKMLLWIMDIWTVISNAKISTVYSSIKMGWRFWCCNGNRCFNGHECVFWKTCLAIKKEGGWGENKNFACGPSLVLHLSQFANVSFNLE